VGHLVRDESVAQEYEMYWQQLIKDPEPDAKSLRIWDNQNFPVPIDIIPPNSVQVLFSSYISTTLLDTKRIQRNLLIR
jgi:hypothetical protein